MVRWVPSGHLTLSVSDNINGWYIISPDIPPKFISNCGVSFTEPWSALTFYKWKGKLSVSLDLNVFLTSCRPTFSLVYRCPVKYWIHTSPPTHYFELNFLFQVGLQWISIEIIPTNSYHTVTYLNFVFFIIGESRVTLVEFKRESKKEMVIFTFICIKFWILFDNLVSFINIFYSCTKYRSGRSVLWQSKTFWLLFYNSTVISHTHLIRLRVQLTPLISYVINTFVYKSLF